MVRGLSTKLLLAGLLSSASLVAAYEIYDEAAQERQHTDATCDVSSDHHHHHPSPLSHSHPLPPLQRFAQN